MLKFAKENQAKEFIVGTEVGMLYPLQKANPDKKFYPALQQAVCPNMKLTNLEKVWWTLDEMNNQVIVPLEIAGKARKSIEAMLSL